MKVRFRSILLVVESAVRRGSDAVVALAGLIVAAPAMIVIALAIRAETAGPVFFSQIRLGRYGRHFRLYKFRKFRHGSGTSGQMVTLKDDPRMTRVGRILERTKLDELPQLWNVLIGDMSIVGPRPESLQFADCFSGAYQRLLDYSPGLFGPSQAIFRNESACYPEDQDPHEFYRTVLFPEKARIDLGYFPSRTLMSDLVWIVRSMTAVLAPSAVHGSWDGVAAPDPRLQAASRHRVTASPADKA